MIRKPPELLPAKVLGRFVLVLRAGKMGCRPAEMMLAIMVSRKSGEMPFKRRTVRKAWIDIKRPGRWHRLKIKKHFAELLQMHSKMLIAYTPNSI